MGPNQQHLQAGDLELRLVGSDLRSVCWKGTEVLQRAYYAVRDAPWNTVPGVIGEITVTCRPDEFSASIRQTHRFEGIDLECELTFAGRADGQLVMRAATLARSAFRYSKVGLNLHHGARTYRGARCRARTMDGMVTTYLDEEIRPQLVVGDTLTAMFAHFDAIDFDLPDVSASLRFEGDRFEMQDHRNWCDANWKTYGTPLEYGFPMDCSAGQRFEQTVTMTLADRGGSRRVGRASGSRRFDVDLVVDLGGVDGVLPSVGVDASAATLHESLAVIAPAFVRLAFDGRNVDHRPAPGAPVEVVVHLEDESVDAARRQVEALVTSGLAVERIVCLAGVGGFSAFRGAAPPDLVGALGVALAESPLADVAVFSGTSQSYNVIARDRPDYPDGAGIVFGAYPQVHAADDESIMENAAAFADVVRDCRRLYPGRPISMSPVHLISDDGPFPAGPPASPSDRPQDDSRYDCAFAAAWSVAVLTSTASAKLDIICLFNADGPRGVVQADGRIKPVGSVLAALAGRAGQATRSASTANPDEVAVLDVGDDASRLVLIANLRPVRRLVSVGGWPTGPSWSVSWIDDLAPAGRGSDAVSVRRHGDRLVVPLEPYSVAMVSPRGVSA